MPPALPLVEQCVWLLLLALPVATIAWTVTHEEVFREFREWCDRRRHVCHGAVARKMFYVFTCEYCFSHWVAALVLTVTGFRLLLADWRGVAIGFFALVAVANVYMSLFGRLRVGIKAERLEVAVREEQRDDRR